MTTLWFKFLAPTLLSILFQNATVWAEPIPATITSLDPRFDQLVSRDAKLEKIADG